MCFNKGLKPYVYFYKFLFESSAPIHQKIRFSDFACLKNVLKSSNRWILLKFQNKNNVFFCRIHFQHFLSTRALPGADGSELSSQTRICRNRHMIWRIPSPLLKHISIIEAGYLKTALSVDIRTVRALRSPRLRYAHRTAYHLHYQHNWDVYKHW